MKYDTQTTFPFIIDMQNMVDSEKQNLHCIRTLHYIFAPITVMKNNQQKIVFLKELNADWAWNECNSLLYHILSVYCAGLNTEMQLISDHSM